MLVLITSSGSIPLKVDNYYIRELASGLDELCFSISIWDDDFQLIQEESSIKEESNGKACYYLVKAIDSGVNLANVKAQIDIDEWKSVLTIGFSSETKTIQQVVNAVKPTGWTVVNEANIPSARTISMDAATPYDVLEQCRITYINSTYRFDNVNKVITIVNMNNGQNLGAFVTRDLNLKENNYMGKSTNFATRLYAEGKDGMTFASINGGKDYVENHSYSDRIICAYWRDERYTIPQNLLADAQAKIDEMAVPQRSYECSVVDLAATNPGKYSELDFKLFSIVGLIDQTRSGAKINHKVVERWIYPYYPAKNQITLSTVAPRIQSQVAQIAQSINNVNSDWNQRQTASFDALSEAILGANGGSVRLLDTNNDGEPDTLYIADDPVPANAEKVWRFNYQGWAASTNGYNGPFTLGATFADGGTFYANVLQILNINASNISTGTLSANRIAAHSLSIGKISGNITGKGYSTDTNSWEIDFDNGTLTVGNINASNIKTGSIDASVITVLKLNASNITTGTLSADRIAANSIAVGKLTGNITNSDWKIDLTNGTFTIGSISANNITAGTLDASSITVTNLNATNITTGTLNVARIGDSSLTGSKLANSTITGGKVAEYTLTGGVGGNIAAGTITGGVGSSWEALGNLSVGGVAYGNTSFTGTLDQVAVNTSDISTLKGYFTGFANFSSLNVSSPLGLSIAYHTLQLVNVPIGDNNYNLVTWS